MSVPFDQRVASDYEAGRRMPAGQMDVWVDILRDELVAQGASNNPLILDLGCGTGRFSQLLAKRCRARVEAVDPSSEMLEVARNHNGSDEVRYQVGSAEAVPLASDSCDGAFLFLCLHHFVDLSGAASELARVCRTKAPVIIRTEFSDRPHQAFWHGLLPDAAAIDVSLFPRYSAFRTAFSEAGLRVKSVANIPYMAAYTLSDYIAGLRTVTISALRLYGVDKVRSALDAIDLDNSELCQPVYEVGKVVTLEVA